MKILITAFEPFENINTNSSLEVLNNIKIKNDNIKKLILPVKLTSSFNILKDEVNKYNPDIIILTGQASKRNKISIETKAKNKITKKTSIEDEVDLNNQIIIDNNIDFITSKFPTNEAYLRLKSLNIPVELSDDAGEYICSSLYFKTMNYYQNIPSVFIHFPLYKKQINNEGIELEILVKGLEEIILLKS